MSLLQINGVDLPTPSDYNIGVQDITMTQRNANGTTLIERIATKKKISITYKVLSGSTLSQILTAVSYTYYDMTYLDPITNTYLTGSFFSGDRDMGMITFIDGNPIYKDLSFEFVER